MYKCEILTWKNDFEYIGQKLCVGKETFHWQQSTLHLLKFTELWYRQFFNLNHLNAEINPICHLLVLLGDLTFMGPCIVSIFQNISNKMQRYTVYLYLEIALHVSGGTYTHYQERIQLSTASGICHTVTATCCYRGRVGTGLSVLWVAYATHSTLKPVPALPR